jgi:hypothetical protein
MCAEDLQHLLLPGTFGGMRLLPLILTALFLFGFPGAATADPALHIPGAVRVEILPGGGRLVTLASGATARMRPLGEGFTVEFSDGRPLERWSRTATGFAIAFDGRVRRVHDDALARFKVDRSENRLTVIVGDAESSRFQHFPLSPRPSGGGPASLRR